MDKKLMIDFYVSLLVLFQVVSFFVQWHLFLLKYIDINIYTEFIPISTLRKIEILYFCHKLNASVLLYIYMNRTKDKHLSYI